MKIFIVLFILVVIIVVSVYAWFGGFRKVDFLLNETGGEVLVYENYTGDYKNTGAIMDSLYYSLLNEEKIETFKGFGIYYDDPRKVEKNSLRSEVGCILESADAQTIERLSARYKIKTFPRSRYLVSEFPYKGKLSVMMGIMKIYPAMNKYILDNNINPDGFVMEIYDVPAKKITYRKSL